LLSKSKTDPFSYPGVPSTAKEGCFDVFDDSFKAQASVGAADSKAVSHESEAYAAFLRSEGQSGELSAMKSDWLQRMRFDIISVQEKYKSDCDAVKMHEEAGKDPREIAKTRFNNAEKAKEIKAMAVDTEEGHVSAFEQVKSFSYMCAECYEDIGISSQSHRKIPCSAAKIVCQFNGYRTCSVSLNALIKSLFHRAFFNLLA
jgi:hypothetical protein